MAPTRMSCRVPPAGCHPAAAYVGSAADASCSTVITSHCVELVVRCNGHSTRMHTYGRNSGSHPAVFHFPVQHPVKAFERFRSLLDKIIQTWQGGGAVLFVCSRGEVRAPCAYGMAMAGIIWRETTIRAEIEELGRKRWIHRMYHYWKPQKT